MALGTDRVSTIIAATVICSIIGLVLGAVFTTTYYNEEYDFETMAPTEGTVAYEDLRQETCSERECSGTGNDRHCHTHYYTCWYPYWDVSFMAPSNQTGNTTWVPVVAQISSNLGYRWRDSALRSMRAYIVGHRYEVWYERQNPSHARWSVPNPFPYYVSMIASWAFLGAVLIVGLLAYYLHQRRGYMSL